MSNFKDPEAAKAYARAYYLKEKARDPEGLKKRQAEASKRHYVAHHAAIVVYQREWRKKNRTREIANKARQKKARHKADPKGTWWLTTVNRRRAATKHKGLSFSLDTKAPCCALPDVCPVLGIRLDYGPKGRGGTTHMSPSIDRIRPSRGYVPGNVRVISHRANMLRSNATVEELRLVWQDALQLK